jgi:hypothetical protein
MKPILIRLPIQIVSAANSREHWGGRAARARNEQRLVRWAVGPQVAALRQAVMRVRGEGKPSRRQGQEPLPFRLHVALTRIGSQKMDTDNLGVAFKAIRDAVAGCVHLDDGDEAIRWDYAQRSDGKGIVAIEIAVAVEG